MDTWIWNDIPETDILRDERFQACIHVREAAQDQKPVFASSLSLLTRLPQSPITCYWCFPLVHCHVEVRARFCVRVLCWGFFGLLSDVVGSGCFLSNSFDRGQGFGICFVSEGGKTKWVVNYGYGEVCISSSFRKMQRCVHRRARWPFEKEERKRVHRGAVGEIKHLVRAAPVWSECDAQRWRSCGKRSKNEMTGMNRITQSRTRMMLVAAETLEDEL